ncbi:MAG: ABC transporter ATP-binding protein [Clostridia bacterium]
MAALEVRNLCAGYGRARILFGLSLEVAAGEVLALLGRNGAGKSTTLKAVMGLVAPDSGEVSLSGRPLAGLDPFEIARRGIGYVPEDRRVFAGLTVAENLEAGRKEPAGEAPRWDAGRVFSLFPSLERRKDHPAGLLSGGEQQMLSVGRTLMGNPSVLLLDEPSEGLAPLVVRAMADAVLELKRAGLAVLLSEQDFRFAERVGDRACLLAQGRIVASGGVGELRENALR